MNLYLVRVLQDNSASGCVLYEEHDSPIELSILLPRYLSNAGVDRKFIIGAKGLLLQNGNDAADISTGNPLDTKGPVFIPVAA